MLFPLFVQIALAAAPAIPPEYLDPGCTTENAPASKTDGRIHFIEDPAGKTVYVPCDKRNLGYRVRKAVAELKARGSDFRGDSRWGKSLIGTNPYEFLASRVELFTIDSTWDNCNDASAFYFNPLEKDSRLVGICPRMQGLSMEALKAVLLHEARHADDKPHSLCDHGPHSGTKGYACDPSLDTKGSYAVGFEYALATANDRTSSEMVRQEARANAVQDLVNRFNKLPKGLIAGAAVFPKAGGVKFYGGGKPVNLLAEVPRGFTLSTRGSTLWAFNAKTGEHMRFAYGQGFKTSNAYLYFQNLKPEKRAMFRDYAEIGDMMCFLFVRSLSCATEESEFFEDVTYPEEYKFKRFWIVDKKALSEANPAEKLALLITTDDRAVVVPNKHKDWMDEKGVRVMPTVKDYIVKTKDLMIFPPNSPMPYEKLHIDVKSGDLTGWLWPKKVKLWGTETVSGFENMPLDALYGPFIWSPLLDRI